MKVGYAKNADPGGSGLRTLVARPEDQAKGSSIRTMEARPEDQAKGSPFQTLPYRPGDQPKSLQNPIQTMPFIAGPDQGMGSGAPTIPGLEGVSGLLQQLVGLTERQTSKIEDLNRTMGKSKAPAPLPFAGPGRINPRP